MRNLRIKRAAGVLLSLALMLSLAACGQEREIVVPDLPAETAQPGHIYLYGETHGVPAILDKELELWQDYYAQGMRHLFVELPWYTADFLNQWMTAEDDAILDAVYDDWNGTLSHNPDIKSFYQAIKETCPETVFHGIDVGHQSDTTGARYLDTLRDAGEADSAAYRAAEACISQGETYYGNMGPEGEAYRENTMYENFCAAYDSLDGASVMAICGSMHTDPDAVEPDSGVPTMAAQLTAAYGDKLHAAALDGSGEDGAASGG